MLYEDVDSNISTYKGRSPKQVSEYNYTIRRILWMKRIRSRIEHYQ